MSRAHENIRLDGTPNQNPSFELVWVILDAQQVDIHWSSLESQRYDTLYYFGLDIFPRTGKDLILWRNA